MGEYFLHLALVAIFIIGITATVGVLTNGIGNLLFGGRKRTEFDDKSTSIQTNWKQVGGKAK